MTLPGETARVLDTDPTALDPFGLWQNGSLAQPASSAEALSFALPADEVGAPAAVWTLALTGGPQGRQANERELERLAGRLQAIETGLASAGPRVDALLAARTPGSASPKSRSIPAAPPPAGAPAPESGSPKSRVIPEVPPPVGAPAPGSGSPKSRFIPEAPPPVGAQALRVRSEDNQPDRSALDVLRPSFETADSSSFAAAAPIPEVLPPPAVLPPPEAGLALALSSLAPARPQEAASFAVSGEPQAAPDWSALFQKLSAFIDLVNRQALHFAWVDTTLDGRLVARTLVNWAGDFTTLWQPGLDPQDTSAHCRSLELAVASRLAYLRTILTISQIAGKITLAVTTPLGPIQALSLAWQFVNSVISQCVMSDE